MGRICPILNHSLNDGVLIEDEAIVSFIQKRNLDFLPTELVCRSCKREIIKLYNKKLKRAIALHKALRDIGTVSSYLTSKSSSASSQSESSFNSSLQNGHPHTIQNGKRSSSTSINQMNSSKISSKVANAPILSVSETAIVISTSLSNKDTILQENGNNSTANKTTISEIPKNQSNVTIRKKTMRDYLTAETLVQNVQRQQHTQHPILATAATTADGDNEDDVTRRRSQSPSTSHAANKNKRPLSTIFEGGETTEDSDSPLILHAVRSTRLPNIQPIPPKRRRSDQSTSLAQDIMNEYIKDIHGG